MQLSCSTTTFSKTFYIKGSLDIGLLGVCVCVCVCLTLHSLTRIQLVWAQGLCSYGASRFFIMATRLESDR